MTLKWTAIDWKKNWMDVYAPKTNRRRIVPICAELQTILSEGFDPNDGAQKMVIPDLGYCQKDMHRPAIQMIKAAGVEQYEKPFHTLRKNREQDWNDEFPFHVVVEWMGHSPTVAQKNYLRIDEMYIEQATKKKKK